MKKSIKFYIILSHLNTIDAKRKTPKPCESEGECVLDKDRFLGATTRVAPTTTLHALDNGSDTLTQTNTHGR
jgi:hypothetical protein